MVFAKMVDDNTILLECDASIYDSQAIVNASYKFTDSYVIYCKAVSETRVGVFIKSKEGCDAPLDKMEGAFCNELIDQQVRINVEKECGAIRNELVKRAFSPITR